MFKSKFKRLKIKIMIIAGLAGFFFLVLIIGAVCVSIPTGGGDNGNTVSNIDSTANYNGNVDSLPISKNLIAFLESWEGFSATGYSGQDYWNVTIGFGHVEEPGEHFTTLTKQDAENLLIKDLQTKGYIRSVQNNFSGCKLSQNQFDALVSLAYNLGSNIWSEISLTQDIKNGKSDDLLRDDFEVLCHVDDSDSSGLLRRRTAEWIMYTKGIYRLN